MLKLFKFTLLMTLALGCRTQPNVEMPSPLNPNQKVTPTTSTPVSPTSPVVDGSSGTVPGTTAGTGTNSNSGTATGTGTSPDTSKHEGGGGFEGSGTIMPFYEPNDLKEIICDLSLEETSADTKGESSIKSAKSLVHFTKDNVDKASAQDRFAGVRTDDLSWEMTSDQAPHDLNGHAIGVKYQMNPDTQQYDFIAVLDAKLPQAKAETKAGHQQKSALFRLNENIPLEVSLETTAADQTTTHLDVKGLCYCVFH